MNFELNDVELFFLKRALEWRIQNIDYFIEKKKLEGLKKANQLSEKATLISMVERIDEALANKNEEQEEPAPVEEAITEG